MGPAQPHPGAGEGAHRGGCSQAEPLPAVGAVPRPWAEYRWVVGLYGGLLFTPGVCGCGPRASGILHLCDCSYNFQMGSSAQRGLGTCLKPPSSQQSWDFPRVIPQWGGGALVGSGKLRVKPQPPTNLPYNLGRSHPAEGRPQEGLLLDQCWRDKELGGPWVGSPDGVTSAAWGPSLGSLSGSQPSRSRSSSRWPWPQRSAQGAG